jgi:O-antigen/teichoic acid export membrane protein
MSRAKRVLHNVASGYATLGVTALYSLVSFPLALVYLSKDEFGLWNAITPLAGYLALIDMGMSISVGRALFEFKDHPESGEYGGVIQTGFLVLLVQGFVVLSAGWVLAPWLAQFMNIEARFESQFIFLLRWQCAITAAGFATKMFTHLLIAQHRYEIINHTQSMNMALNLALLWCFFKLGWKLNSLPMTGGLCWVFSSGNLILACFRLHVFPKAGAWGRPSWSRFRELLWFGKDVFLVALGYQFIMASQTIIVTRVMGVGAATVLAGCTKAFTLVSQLIWRIFDFSSSVFLEMIVRREAAKLYERFRDLVIVTATLAAFIGVMFAVCNEPFMAVWTSRKVGWSNLNDCLLGIWLIIVSVLRCHSGHVVNTKQLGFLRYIYFVEGLVFFGAASLVTRQGGYSAMFLTSIVCSLLFSGAYCVHRTRGYFHLSLREVLWNWLQPMVKLLAILVPWAGLVWFALRGGTASAPSLAHERWRLAANALLVGLPGLYLLLRLGIPQPMKVEIAQRTRGRFGPLVKRLLAV